ncbi:unnamed protein product [Arctia plantaginis]|uniref:Uncharacterized protein n=1 Tax=Arctia plantaginis TaxID=874455 RepID=A0A8S1B020_ARCPL|nr:unnamed protein product [Arctia plantaginis]
MKYVVVFLLVCVALAAAAPAIIAPYAAGFVAPYFARPRVVFLLVCVALAAAAPAIIAPYAAGFVAPYFARPRTVVAGPTVVNGLGSQITYPGYIGTTFF